MAIEPDTTHQVTLHGAAFTTPLMPPLSDIAKDLLDLTALAEYVPDLSSLLNDLPDLSDILSRAKAEPNDPQG
jgi:hypothetical protein